MVVFAIAIVGAVIPSLLIMWYFHARDVYPEPPKVLWATFGLGILTIPGVLLVVLPLFWALDLDAIEHAYLGGFVDAFVGAAIPEESFKFLVVLTYCMRHKEFDEPMDGIVYGVAASLGFATLENVMYVATGGIGLAVMRAFTSVPGHAAWGAVMGYFVGQAKFRPAERGKLLASALLWPILLHGIYDLPLLAMKRQEGRSLSELEQALKAPGFIVFLLALIISVVWAYRVAKRLRKEQFEHAVATGAAQNPLHPAAAALAKEQAPPSKPVSWLMILFGVVLTGAGGLMALAFTVVLVGGDYKSGELGQTIAIGVFMGLVPLGIGIAMFASGIRRLNKARPHEAQWQGHQAYRQQLHENPQWYQQQYYPQPQHPAPPAGWGQP